MISRVACAIILCAASARAEPGPCSGRLDGLVLDSARHDLHLCESGRAIATYKVAIGRSGIGKQREGDNRTPSGAYRLGTPRPSKEFGTFIPVAYPTAAQRSRGFTGSDVGVHGPKRSLRWLGSANRWVDWTRGCIATASDEDLAAILTWLERRPAATIAIE